MQRSEILEHMVAHENNDLYWCPMLFSEDKRQVEYANEEYALWADLDEADPHEIEEQWRPTIAWETSPGRYQALWLLKDCDEEDLYGASKRGADNQRMTYMVGADPSGWDTTQLLRLPGWTNHKPQYLDGDGFPEGQLLWEDGPRYTGHDFDSLPEVVVDEEADEQLPEQIESVEAGEVLDRVKYLLPKKMLTRLKAGPQAGDDRSRVMAYFMVCLAEVGCSVAEIVAVLQPTDWNKFRGRTNELDILITQATEKYNKHKPTKAEKYEYTPFFDINDYMSSATPPRWLVRDMITRGSVGFIGGEPKARKSWVALDLALSIAGASAAHQMRFLGQFKVETPGPVLYFVLEDGNWLMKDRIKQVWGSKTKYDGTRMVSDGKGGVEVALLNGRVEAHLAVITDCIVNFADPDCMASVQQIIRQGYPMSDGSTIPYALVIFDTFMRSVGGSDINSLGEMMNPILDPLTKMAKRNDTTILLVHHYNKSKVEGEVRGGTRLMGSQALYAWAEDSLYLTAGDHSFGLALESKTAPANSWAFITDPRQKTWAPRLVGDNTPPIRDLDFAGVEQPSPRKWPHSRKPKVVNALNRLGPGGHTCADIARAANMAPSNTHAALKKAAEYEFVVKDGKFWHLAS
jgi:hypothetical protein